MTCIIFHYFIQPISSFHYHRIHPHTDEPNRVKSSTAGVTQSNNVCPEPSVQNLQSRTFSPVWAALRVHCAVDQSTAFTSSSGSSPPGQRSQPVPRWPNLHNKTHSRFSYCSTAGPPRESAHCVTHREQMWSGPRSPWRSVRPAASLCGPRAARRLRTGWDPRRRWAGSSSSPWTSGWGSTEPLLLDLLEPPVLLTLCRRGCAKAKAKANANTRAGQKRLVTSDKDEQVRVAPVWKLSSGGSVSRPPHEGQSSAGQLRSCSRWELYEVLPGSVTSVSCHFLSK